MTTPKIKNAITHGVGSSKQPPVEIVCIIDRSNSMDSIHSEVIGGLNKFIAEQKNLGGKANITLVEFDDEYSVLNDRVDLQQINEFNMTHFVPRGMTALNDAIGKTVARFTLLQEQGGLGKVIYCIMTDGGENASKEFKQTGAVKKLIEKAQGDFGWQFVFLAANIDAFSTAHNYGMQGMTRGFAANAAGVGDAYATYSASVTTFRAQDAASGGGLLDQNGSPIVLTKTSSTTDTQSS